MFCPNCGNPDHQEKSYCRQCGEFLPRLKKRTYLKTNTGQPEESTGKISFINFICVVSCLIMGLLLFSTMENRGDKTFVVTVAGILLINIAIWQTLEIIF